MMKRIASYIAGAVTGIILMSAPIFADSYSKTIEALVNFTTVKINGKTIQSDNFVVDGKTYVWIRDIAEMFGKEIEWDGETNTADIVNELTKVVATVDDVKITNIDIKTTSMLNSPGGINADSIQSAFNFEIDNAVILNEAEKSGFGLNDELKAFAAEQIAQFKDYYGDEADSVLASYNLTSEKYLSMMETNLVADNFYKQIRKSKTFSDDEVKAKYDEISDSFIEVTAKHILVKTDDKSEDEAKKQIEQIKKELKSVEMFDELMAKYSEDTGSKDDIDGMTFGKGQMVPEFENAAFTQEIGIIGDPVKTNYGYHIVLVTARTEKEIDEVRDVCEDELFSEWFNEQVKVWKDNANIVIFNEELEAMKNNL